jgi:hypothetical protein
MVLTQFCFQGLLEPLGALAAARCLWVPSGCVSWSLLGALGGSVCDLGASWGPPVSFSARYSQQDFSSKGCLTRCLQQDYVNTVSFAGFSQQGFLKSFLTNVSSRRIPQQCVLRQVSSARFPKRGLLSKVLSVKLPDQGCLSKFSSARFLSKVFSAKLPQYCLSNVFQNQCYSRNPCLGSHAGVILCYVVVLDVVSVYSRC